MAAVWEVGLGRRCPAAFLGSSPSPHAGPADRSHHASTLFYRSALRDWAGIVLDGKGKSI